MPSSVRVRVVEARDLPEMDRTVRGESCTDAYVDIKFHNYEQVIECLCVYRKKRRSARAMLMRKGYLLEHVEKRLHPSLQDVLLE